jgi:hypothetical protein
LQTDGFAASIPTKPTVSDEPLQKAGPMMTVGLPSVAEDSVFAAMLMLPVSYAVPLED